MVMAVCVRKMLLPRPLGEVSYAVWRRDSDYLPRSKSCPLHSEAGINKLFCRCSYS